MNFSNDDVLSSVSFPETSSYIWPEVVSWDINGCQRWHSTRKMYSTLWRCITLKESQNAKLIPRIKMQVKILYAWRNKIKKLCFVGQKEKLSMSSWNKHLIFPRLLHEVHWHYRCDILPFTLKDITGNPQYTSFSVLLIGKEYEADLI